MKLDQSNEIIIKEFHALQTKISLDQSLQDCTIQDVDLTQVPIAWDEILIDNTTFLGCLLHIEDELKLREKGATMFIRQNHLPYNPYRKGLYTWYELMKGYQQSLEDSLDYQIYEHFSKTRFNPSVKEALYQRIHDHSIDDALRVLIGSGRQGLSERRCVGIMGGHNIPRTDEFYEKTAKTAKLLTENGYFVVSGGGPGIMEAANLGAYLAGRKTAEFRDALAILRKAPRYQDAEYLNNARRVLDKYPDGQASLAIPTWFYGHEPSNIFATHIAKYFSNSIREDTLLAISLHGIIFAPGSAGTTQEIFMDAAQNHYGTYNYYSPMIFLGRQRYEIDTLIFPLLRQLSWGRDYHKLLFITDTPQKIVQFLQKHPPIQKNSLNGRTEFKPTLEDIDPKT